MIQILEYISQNYTLLLSVLVLILLAIIGYYADKTNFGQGKNQEKEIETKNQQKIGLSDALNIHKKEIINNEQKNISENEDKKNKINIEEQKDVSNLNLKEEKNIEEQKDISNLNLKEEKIISNIEELKKNQINEEKLNFDNPKLDNKVTIKEIEVNSDVFDEEINILLPKKQLISDDLLNEIDELSLNTSEKKNSFEIPDLDDISLPKIKNLVEKEQDIWKF